MTVHDTLRPYERTWCRYSARTRNKQPFDDRSGSNFGTDPSNREGRKSGKGQSMVNETKWSHYG